MEAGSKSEVLDLMKSAYGKYHAGQCSGVNYRCQHASVQKLCTWVDVAIIAFDYTCQVDERQSPHVNP